MNLRVETEREDDGRWIAEVPDLPGVLAYGPTRESAVARAEALTLRVIKKNRLKIGKNRLKIGKNHLKIGRNHSIFVRNHSIFVRNHLKIGKNHSIFVRNRLKFSKITRYLSEIT